MSDAVRAVAEMLHARFSGRDADLPRYYDQIVPKKEEKEQETAEDVISRIMKNLTEMGS